MFNGLYSNGSRFAETTPFLDNWVLGLADPLQNKAAALVAFCFPNSPMLVQGSLEAKNYESLKALLTIDNLKHFLKQYKNFHNHWPIIHLPTFNPLDVDNGLLFTIICIGAVYSDRLGVQQVRWLMELARSCILRSSRLYQLVSQGAKDGLNTITRISTNLEELQALILLNSLSVWHGNPQQRKEGRDEFWVLADAARRLNLLSPLPNGHVNYSALHQPGPLRGDEINSWTWKGWVEEEKRVRTMHLLFLISAALTMYFNERPHFDIYEVKNPLPADDAAWEARSQEECASALGLRGEAAQSENTTGSKRPKQIGMAEALHLLHQGGEFPQRATNAFSKFILIHAIHIEIYEIQRQVLGLSNLPSYNGRSSSGNSTPQSQNDWGVDRWYC